MSRIAQHLRQFGNVSISILGQASPQISSLIITITAARYLIPAEYGVYALALVFAEFNITFTYTGYFYYIINSKESDESVLSTFFWVMLAIGTVLATVLFFSSSALAHVFSNESLALIIAAFALFQPVQSAVGWASASLIRAKLMRRYFITLAASEFISLAVGVVIVVIWQSLAALVAYRLIKISLTFLLFASAVPRWPRFSFDLQLAKQATSYALGLYSARVLNFFSRFGTDLILAFLFSTTESGLYRFANRIASGTVDIVAQPLRRYAEKSFGHASRTNLPLSPIFAQYFSANVLAMGGVACAIAVLSYSAVAVLFQPAYLAAVGAVYALAFLAAARAGNQLIVPVFAATHRTGIAFWHDLIWTTAMLGTIVIAAPYGFTTLAFAQAAVMVVTSLAALFMVRQFGHIAIGDAVRAGSKVLLLLALYATATVLAYQHIVAAWGETMPALVAGSLVAAGLGLLTIAVAMKFNAFDLKVFAD